LNYRFRTKYDVFQKILRLSPAILEKIRLNCKVKGKLIIHFFLSVSFSDILQKVTLR